MADYEFSDAVKLHAYQNAGAHCECTDACKEHPNDRCKVYFWRYTEAHYYPIDPEAPLNMYNCRMLCLRCRRNLEAAAPTTSEN
ncbi:MAG: hypothetical protein ACRKGH_06915 [Dehalogenimonas sp.]